MVHLAPMGYTYDGTLNSAKQKVARGAFRQPLTTFCGRSVAELATRSKTPAAPVKVMLPHDHDDACSVCLKALAGRETDQVQPLLF